MKIVFVLPNLSSGGAERVVTILSKGLIDKNITVDILLLQDDLVHYSVPDGVNVVCLNTKGMSRFQRFRTIRKYLKTIKKDKPILVPFQDSCLKNVLLAKIGLKIPVVATERNNPFRKGITRWAKFKATLPLKFSNFAVFQTPDARRYYSGLKDKKCKVIANPITNVNVRWQGNVEPDKLISVCRLHSQKNLPMLMDAIEIVKKTYNNVNVKIYGEGELRESLEQKIKDKDLVDNISLCGRTDAVHQKMAESSIYLCSSNFEGISNSMLEAMSIGMPIISTDCPIGGAKMMLENGAGILTPVGDAQQFAKEIIRLFENKELACELAQKALERSRLYSEPSIIEEWIKVFNAL